jgi:hypothetical protein
MYISLLLAFGFWVTVTPHTFIWGLLGGVAIVPLAAALYCIYLRIFDPVAYKAI